MKNLDEQSRIFYHRFGSMASDQKGWSRWKSRWKSEIVFRFGRKPFFLEKWGVVRVFNHPKSRVKTVKIQEAGPVGVLRGRKMGVLRMMRVMRMGLPDVFDGKTALTRTEHGPWHWHGPRARCTSDLPWLHHQWWMVLWPNWGWFYGQKCLIMVYGWLN